MTHRAQTSRHARRPFSRRLGHPLSRRLSQPLRATALAALAMLSLPAAPAEFHWRADCASATWDSFCWSSFAGGPVTPALPGADAEVFIRQGGATPRTVQYRQVASAPMLQSVLVDSSGSGSMTLAQDRDTLQTRSMTLGALGAGTMTLAGGQLTVTTRLMLGDGAAARGSFAQSAGRFDLLGDAIVGGAGQGVWQHGGGVAGVGGSLVLGQRAGGVGNLQVSGGTLSVLGDLRRGDGFGALRLDGGTLDVRGQLQLDSVVLAGTAGGDVRFDAVAGRTLDVGTLVVGQAGQGTLAVSGQARAEVVTLGQLAGGRGTLWLQPGGSFTGTTLQRGAGESALWLDGGTLALGQAFDVDALVIGATRDLRWASTQDHRVRGTLVLGQAAGTEGTLVLEDGTLQAGQLARGAGRSQVVFDGGALALDSGVLVADRVAIASQAGAPIVTHTLASGQSVQAGHTVVGERGGARLRLTSGEWRSDTLVLGQDAGASGVVTLSGGLLMAGRIERGAGGSELRVDGGRLQVAGDADIGLLRVLEPSSDGIGWQGPGTLRLDTLQLEQDLYGDAFVQAGGRVEVAGDMVLLADSASWGRYTLESGVLQVAGDIGPGGRLSLLGGEVVAGGRIAPEQFWLGREGGDVTMQLGDGRHLAPSNLNIGGRGHGALVVDGGAVDVVSMRVGHAIGTGNDGAGTVVLRRGTVQVVTSVVLGRGVAGRWEQHAGGMLDAMTLVVGDTTSASFEQLAGAVRVAGLVIAADRGSAGTAFVQRGGTLQVDGVLTIGAADRGSFELHGGEATVGGQVLVGGGGSTSTLRLLGGTLNAARIGPSTAASRLLLDGGTLAGANEVEVALIQLGSQAGLHGVHRQTAGTVQARLLHIGALGQGDWQHDGGTLRVSERLMLGDGAAAVGRLQVRGGEVTADTLHLWGGELHLQGGRLAVERFELGGADPGGWLRVDGGELALGAGVSHAVGELTVGAQGQAAGSFALRRGAVVDGTLLAPELQAGTGVLNRGRVETTLRFEAAGDSVNQGLWRAAGWMGGSGRFVNEGLFEQAGGLRLAQAVHNAGTWQARAGSSTTLDGIDFTNAGELDLARSPLLGSGRLVNAAGGLIVGAGRVETLFDNDGTLVVDAGSASFTQGFVNRGEVQLGSAAAVLSGGAVRNEGTVAGQGQWRAALDNAGQVQALGGTLVLHALASNTGTLAAGTGARLRVVGGLAQQDGLVALDGGQFDNDGAAQRNAGRIEGAGSWRGGPLAQAGVLSASGGALRVMADVVALAGSTTRATGGGRLIVDGAFELQRDAVLRVAGGSAAAFLGDVRLRNGSVVEGAGTLDFEGSLAVGDSPGSAWLPGDVRFGTGHVYTAEIGGLEPGSGFDRLVVGGTLTLGGTLSLAWWDGFSAAAGDRFDLFDAAALTGHFDALDFSGAALADGLVWDTSRLHLDGVLAVAAVPEPGTWAMWLAGAAVLAGLSRRRAPRG